MAVLLADDVPERFQTLHEQDLLVTPLTESGELLDQGYALFQRVFDVSVLDPKKVYCDRMSPVAFFIAGLLALLRNRLLRAPTRPNCGWLCEFRPHVGAG